jgi:hypothetical protein
LKPCGRPANAIAYVLRVIVHSTPGGSLPGRDRPRGLDSSPDFFAFPEAGNTKSLNYIKAKGT